MPPPTPVRAGTERPRKKRQGPARWDNLMPPGLGWATGVLSIESTYLLGPRRSFFRIPPHSPFPFRFITIITAVVVSSLFVVYIIAFYLFSAACCTPEFSLPRT